MKIPPIIAPILRNRFSAFIVIFLPLLFVFLNISGLFEWKCPFYSFFHVQCFGCGMTRAVNSILNREFSSAFCYHPFSYILITGWLFFVIITLFPESKRNLFFNKLEIVEKKSGFVFILFLFFIFFGLVRLLFQIYD